MAVQSETFRPQTVQYVAPKPQQAEAVYIHSVFHLKHDQYKGRLSFILGIILIVLQTLAIILNIIGVVLQHHRNDDRPFWKGNLAFATFPSIWCGIFVYISAGSAIAAGKLKTRGLIIAHLVLACIAAVFAFVCGCFTCAAVAYEAGQDIETSTDKGSISVAVIWLIFSWLIFILIMWCAVLCCKVLCCGRIKEAASIEMVTPINPPGTVILHTDTTEEKAAS